ncbi:hypothetical protein, partial [Ligilactobacillus equi]|uniref:hypothetical protein n=1 Tax=Ligilactobacillus equi TaxID=137357 RepID=UPI0005595D5C
VLDGKGNDVTKQFNVQFDDKKGSFKVTAKKAAKLISTFGGQKLNVVFYATPKSGLKNGTEIDNTAQQVNAGNVYKTNMVKNYVYNLDPKKDVIENLGNPKSLDQQQVGF